MRISSHTFALAKASLNAKDIYAVFRTLLQTGIRTLTRRVALEHGFQVNNSARVGLYDLR
ncbi:MAG UNVERIFIED_CONTAM: hypothetical protein LVT10_05580 [Anaerolineae bacterium]